MGYPLTSTPSQNDPKSAWRYAVYIAPEPGSTLAQFGRAWLGYDPETGTIRSDEKK